MSEFIKTKLMVEFQPAKFVSLGFGDIAHSEADVVCVSSFRETSFVRNSAIGSLASKLGGEALSHRLQLGHDDVCSLINVEDLGTSLKNVLVVWMRYPSLTLQGQDTEQDIQTGLLSAVHRIQAMLRPEQIDVVALGTQYAGVHRRQVFDRLVAWGVELFKQCPCVNHVRLVSYDMDTFVDFYEALHRLQGLKWNEPSPSTFPTAGKLGDFEKEIRSAIKLLDQNPVHVLVICRTIVEKAIDQLCRQKLLVEPMKLVDRIRVLYEAGHIPPQINSFLHTCRVIGNFAAHPGGPNGPLDASRRDAEAVMVLTLRIVEWFLEATSDVQSP